MTTESEYDFAVRWWRRFGDCPPQISNETTQRMIDDKVIGLVDCFKNGLPMGTGTYKRARDAFNTTF